MGSEEKLTSAVMAGDCLLTLQMPEFTGSNPEKVEAQKLESFIPLVDRFESCLTAEDPAERLVRHEREFLRLFLLWVSSNGPAS